MPEPTSERTRLLQAGVRLSGREHRFDWISDDVERFAQVAQPGEVLIGRTLEEQAESLAGWILGGFEALSVPLESLQAA